jgi:hypothetical protein
MRDNQKYNTGFVSTVGRYLFIHDYTKGDYSRKHVIERVEWKQLEK